MRQAYRNQKMAQKAWLMTQQKAVKIAGFHS
jgi:hypothetical protein